MKANGANGDGANVHAASSYELAARLEKADRREQKPHDDDDDDDEATNIKRKARQAKSWHRASSKTRRDQANTRQGSGARKVPSGTLSTHKGQGTSPEKPVDHDRKT